MTPLWKFKKMIETGEICLLSLQEELQTFNPKDYQPWQLELINHAKTMILGDPFNPILFFAE